MKKKQLLKDIRDLYKIIDIEVDKNINYKMKIESLEKEIRKLHNVLDTEIDENMAMGGYYHALLIEVDIVKRSLVSCENALREKEVIITYLEMRGN